jgi:hypothetical protein
MPFGFADAAKMPFGFADAAELVSSGLNLYQAFSGPDKSSAEKGASRSAKAAETFAQWAADPTSPGFRNLAALFEEVDRRRAAEAMDRSMRQNARAKARGDPGFVINPERRDESRYSAMMDAFMQAKERSRMEARNTLLTASQAATGAAGAYPVQAGVNREALGQEMRAGSNEALASIGAMADRFLRAQPSTPTQPRSGAPTLSWPSGALR